MKVQQPRPLDQADNSEEAGLGVFGQVAHFSLGLRPSELDAPAVLHINVDISSLPCASTGTDYGFSFHPETSRRWASSASAITTTAKPVTPSQAGASERPMNPARNPSIA